MHERRTEEEKEKAREKTLQRKKALKERRELHQVRLQDLTDTDELCVLTPHGPRKVRIVRARETGKQFDQELLSRVRDVSLVVLDLALVFNYIVSRLCIF